MSDLKPNAELAYLVLDYIDAHPEQWDQGTWVSRPGDCGTAGCFAGWVCLLSGDQPIFAVDADETDRVSSAGDEVYVPERAAYLLDIEFSDDLTWGNALFNPNQNREELGARVAAIFGPRPAVSA
jgi:hypothetical protein